MLRRYTLYMHRRQPDFTIEQAKSAIGAMLDGAYKLNEFGRADETGGGAIRLELTTEMGPSELGPRVAALVEELGAALESIGPGWAASAEEGYLPSESLVPHLLSNPLDETAPQDDEVEVYDTESLKRFLFIPIFFLVTVIWSTAFSGWLPGILACGGLALALVSGVVISTKSQVVCDSDGILIHYLLGYARRVKWEDICEAQFVPDAMARRSGPAIRLYACNALRLFPIRLQSYGYGSSGSATTYRLAGAIMSRGGFVLYSDHGIAGVDFVVGLSFRKPDDTVWSPG